MEPEEKTAGRFGRRPGFKPVTHQPIAWVRSDLGTTGFKADHWSERESAPAAVEKKMDPSGIEPLTPGCKPGVLPLALQAHGPDALASGRGGGGDGTRTHTQDLMRVPVCQLIVPRNMGTAAWPSRET